MLDLTYMLVKQGAGMKKNIMINNLYAMIAISMGHKLKQLFDEIYNQGQPKTPEEVRDILEKLHVLEMLCEELDKQYSHSGTYLSMLLDAAGGHASLYFRRYSDYLKKVHQKGSKLKKVTLDLTNKKQKTEHHSHAAKPGQPHTHDHKTSPPKIVETYSQYHLIGVHINECGLFYKYKDAKEGSVEYVKNDFMNHYNPAKHHSLNEALLERSKVLHMSPAKYKENLIHGLQSKMEALVNLIEPDWSKEPAPISDHNEPVLDEHKNMMQEHYFSDQKIGDHINEYSLFNKYQHAQEGSVEYVKNDFMNHYDPAQHQSLDELLLERSKALGMHPAKYKEDLIHGSSSKMEILVNLIEPGWSKQPPPTTQDEDTTLKSK